MIGLLKRLGLGKSVGKRSGYGGSKESRTVRGFKIKGTVSQQDVLRRDLEGLVAHSRLLARDNDYMKRFLAMCQNHVIGHAGIRLQMQARRPSADGKGELDTAANSKIERAWQDWGKKGNCTVCGRFTWLDVQHQVARNVPRDGNVFARMRMGKDRGPYGMQLQLLTIDHLDTEMCLDLGGGSYVEAGIEFNDDDRPVAFHCFRQHPHASHHRNVRRDKVRIPAGSMLHLYVPTDPSLCLGEPWAHTALRRLNLLGGYEEAAVTSARAGASKMGFITREFVADVDDDKALTEAGEPEVEELEPGTVETLPVGYDFKSFDPGYPDGEMGEFMRVVLRGAAAGLGVSYASFANDLKDVNFSSMRGGLNEERDGWRVVQRFMMNHLCDPVFSTWLDTSLMMGAIALPQSKFDQFNAPSWRPRGWAAVQPREEATANAMNLENGFRSPQEIVGDRGEDLEEVYQQIAEAQRLADQYGLSFTAAQQRAPSSEQQQD